MFLSNRIADEHSAAHIVYASDNYFAEILGVSLVSLFENSKDMSEIYVYILDDGIDEVNRLRIEEVCTIYGRHMPFWLKARNIVDELNINVSVDRGSLVQYARLFISRDLPRNISKVLYLDCDILVMQSISELWNLDMQGKTVAALRDAFSKYYRKNIDLDEDDIMFNSGVMLINLDNWKNRHIEEQILKVIIDKNGRIQQGDQGALNAVLAKDVYCFDPKFNSVTIFYDFTYTEMLTYRKPQGFYPESKINNAVNNPVLIHFTTSFLSKRPWVEGCKHKYCYLWKIYKEKTPWRNEALRKDNRAKWKLFGAKVFQLLPRSVAIGLAGILQAYGRPALNNILLKVNVKRKIKENGNVRNT